MNGIELDGYVIGDSSPIFIYEFEEGSADLSTSDIENPIYDETYMGRDLLRGPTWTFTLATNSYDEVQARAEIGKLQAIWQDRQKRTAAGTVRELKYRVAGRTRIVYGRPRRWRVDYSSAPSGVILIDCDFQLSDPLHYDEHWQSVELTMAPPLRRGLRPPLTPPISVRSGGRRQGIIDYVGGDGQTPIWVDIRGPVTRPSITFAGNSLSWDLTVPEGHTLQVNTREGWARLNGAGVVGAMGRRTRLKGIRIAPGSNEISFAGDDPTMNSSAKFWWRPAHYAL